MADLTVGRTVLPSALFQGSACGAGRRQDRPPHVLPLTSPTCLASWRTADHYGGIVRLWTAAFHAEQDFKMWKAAVLSGG